MIVIFILVWQKEKLKMKKMGFLSFYKNLTLFHTHHSCFCNAKYGNFPISCYFLLFFFFFSFLVEVSVNVNPVIPQVGERFLTKF